MSRGSVRLLYKFIPRLVKAIYSRLINLRNSDWTGSRLNWYRNGGHEGTRDEIHACRKSSSVDRPLRAQCRRRGYPFPRVSFPLDWNVRPRQCGHVYAGIKFARGTTAVFSSDCVMKQDLSSETRRLREESLGGRDDSARNAFEESRIFYLFFSLLLIKSTFKSSL